MSQGHQVKKIWKGNGNSESSASASSYGFITLSEILPGYEKKKCFFSKAEGIIQKHLYLFQMELSAAKKQQLFCQNLICISSFVFV